MAVEVVAVEGLPLGGFAAALHTPLPPKAAPGVSRVLIRLGGRCPLRAALGRPL